MIAIDAFKLACSHFCYLNVIMIDSYYSTMLDFNYIDMDVFKTDDIKLNE